MRILTLILCAIALVATGLPLIKTGEWWIRIFDFPRIQIAALTLVALILAFIYVNFRWRIKLPLILLLVVSLVYQLQFVVVYTPLYNTQAKDSNEQNPENSFTLLVTNVLMENEDKELFHALVEKHNPDILLVNEPDDKWAESISKLDVDYPHSIVYPLDNTYGIILLSKLPLKESEVNFWVEDDIPSIFTRITLPSGDLIDFYGVHPEPPKPGSDTYEKDTELLLIGKEIKESDNPTIIAGDLNDVGWSKTSKLFRKYSGLVDPREGRGLYNTYKVSLPLLRYPLDHVFYSEEFGLIKLAKLEDIGSDHFPILVELSYEPSDDNTADTENTDAKENEEVEEKIEEGKEEKAKE